MHSDNAFDIRVQPGDRELTEDDKGQFEKGLRDWLKATRMVGLRPLPPRRPRQGGNGNGEPSPKQEAGAYVKSQEAEFRIIGLNPVQFKVARSDRPGSFIVETRMLGLTPEGPHPVYTTSQEDFLTGWLQFGKKDIGKVRRGYPVPIPDSDPRAEMLWGYWDVTDAEELPFAPYTIALTPGNDGSVEASRVPAVTSLLPQTLRQPVLKEKVRYHGGAFKYTDWPSEVRDGDIGFIDEQHHAPAVPGIQDAHDYWVVDFGQGRHVVIQGYGDRFERVEEAVRNRAQMIVAEWSKKKKQLGRELTNEEETSIAEKFSPTYEDFTAVYSYLNTPEGQQHLGNSKILSLVKKGVFPEVEQQVEERLTKWAKLYSIPKPDWYFAEDTDSFYSSDRNLILPADMARVYNKKGFDKLWWEVAHEFYHYYADQGSIPFSNEVEEEVRAGQFATSVTGVSADEYVRAHHELLPHIALAVHDIPQAAVIPLEPEPPPRRENMPEWFADSPEWVAETIDCCGWRDQLDQAFQAAIQRARS